MAKKPKTQSPALQAANEKRRRKALYERNKKATHSGHIDDLKPVAGKKIKVD